MRSAILILALLFGLAAPIVRAQDSTMPRGLNLPVANQLDALGLGDVDRAQMGSWADFFVKHRPNAERMAAVAPQIANLVSAAEAAFKAADYPRCLAQNREVLRILPDFPPSLLVYASAAFRLRRYGDCIEATGRFLEVAPTETWRTQIRAHSLYTLGEFEAAKEHYLAVIDGAPSPKLVSVEAIRGLALAHYRLGEEQLALAGLRQVVAQDSEHGEAYAWLAQVLFDQDQLEQALVAARRSMELMPFEPRPHFLAFRILFELGKDPEAELLEKRWEVLNTAAGEIRTLRNRLLFHVGDPGLLRALAGQHRDLGDLDGLARAIEQLLGVQDYTDPTGLARRVFSIEAFRDMGALERARELRARTEADYPGSELPGVE